MTLPSVPAPQSNRALTVTPFATGLPKEGPASFMATVVIPAGELQATSNIDFRSYGLSQTLSALTYNESNATQINVQFGPQGIVFPLDKQQGQMLPIYSTSGTLTIIVSIPAAQASPTVVSFQVFNTLQPPASYQGSLTANIASGNVTVNGTATVNVANTPAVTLANSPTVNLASGSTVAINNSPTVNLASGTSVSINNSPTINLATGSSVSINNSPTVNLASGSTVAISSGTVSISGTPSVNIANTPSVSISSGSVAISSGTVNATVQNAQINQLAVLTDVHAITTPGSFYNRIRTVGSLSISTANTWTQMTSGYPRPNTMIALAKGTNTSAVQIGIGSYSSPPLVPIAALSANQSTAIDVEANEAIWIYGATGQVIYSNQLTTPDYSLAPHAQAFAAVAGPWAESYVLSGNGSVQSAMPGQGSWAFEFWLKQNGAPTSIAVAVEWNVPTSGGDTKIAVYLASGATKMTLQITYLGTGVMVGTGVTTVTDNKWHHYAVNFDSLGVNAYVDGALDLSSSKVIFPSNSANLYVGIYHDLSSYPWQGYLSEFAIWKYPRYPNPFTPPWAPCYGNEVGIFALYHFNNDMLDYGPGAIS